MAKKRSLKRSSHISVGEILREEFMGPLGLTARKIAKAIPGQIYPKGPKLGTTYWEHNIKILIGEEPDDLFEMNGPNVHLYSALDKYFGLPSGYFLHLWAALAARANVKDTAAWLRRIKPHAHSKRFASLANACPELADYLPATTGAQILRSLEKGS